MGKIERKKSFYNKFLEEEQKSLSKEDTAHRNIYNAEETPTMYVIKKSWLRSFFNGILDTIKLIFLVIIKTGILILASIGLTVLVNTTLREFFIEVIKNIIK